jgi:hypothetical protein
VEIARTHYYSAFAYDHELNHAPPVHASGLVADIFPPDLELAVFQNPYLTRYLDIYMFCSEPADPLSVHIKPGEDSIGVVPVDGREDLWLGQYELAGPGGKLTINGCASDTSGNFTCRADTISTGFISAPKGGMVESADGRLRLLIPQGALSSDTYIVVRACGEARSSDEAAGTPAGPGHLAAPEGGPGPAYTLTPPGILEESSAALEIRYGDCGYAPAVIPDRFVVEQVGVGRLESYVDPTCGTVAAEISCLGTFRLSMGEPGSSEIIDPGYLWLAHCRPNPFTTGTAITFRTKARQHVRIAVYDTRGRLVAEVLDRVLLPGTRSITWVPRSSGGGYLPSGIYFLKITSEHRRLTRKLVLVR